MKKLTSKRKMGINRDLSDQWLPDLFATETQCAISFLFIYLHVTFHSVFVLFFTRIVKDNFILFHPCLRLVYFFYFPIT